MYPSGSWNGFWQQEGYGRQPMEQFEMSFQAGVVRGRGIDIIGPFTIHGECDARGEISLIKQYIAKHAVIYRGQPDGEGSILGTWSIQDDIFGIEFRGPFMMQPVRATNTNDLPIRDL
jgi:hypothetical protein